MSAPRNRSVVIRATTDLTWGMGDDSTVQFTQDATGCMFISTYVYSEPSKRVEVRVLPDDWARFEKFFSKESGETE